MTNTLLNWLAVSPREKAPTPCGDHEPLAGRKPAQMGWYQFAADLAEGCSVLDVGCGSGEGLKLLSARADEALGIDLDERLDRPDVNVRIQSVSDIPDKSFDIVVSMDVIEHVENDAAFVADLFRVARKAVFVTTPNYAVSRNRHPYHVREYTPSEFERLFAGYGHIELMAGSAHGFEHVPVTRRRAYFLVNALYCWKPTVPVAKVLKRLLRIKVWKHNAALVRLPHSAEAAASATAAA